MAGGMLPRSISSLICDEPPLTLTLPARILSNMAAISLSRELCRKKNE